MSQRKYAVATIGAGMQDFLETILRDAGLHVKFEMHDAEPAQDDFETPEVELKFTGPDVDLLLTNKAELLLALEHVAMEMLRVPSEDHSRIAFDANDYRLLRIEELRLSATTAADKVKRTGVPFRFNPMNSRERRVIHLALRNEPAVRSESIGSGPARQVVVYPAGMASLPEPPASSGPGERRPEPRRGGPGSHAPRSRSARR